MHACCPWNLPSFAIEFQQASNHPGKPLSVMPTFRFWAITRQTLWESSFLDLILTVCAFGYLPVQSWIYTLVHGKLHLQDLFWPLFWTQPVKRSAVLSWTCESVTFLHFSVLGVFASGLTASFLPLLPWILHQVLSRGCSCYHPIRLPLPKATKLDSCKQQLPSSPGTLWKNEQRCPSPHSL